MGDVVRVVEAAEILGTRTFEQVRQWMHNHGFEPMRTGPGPKPHVWWREHVEQVRDERIAWGLTEERAARTAGRTWAEADADDRAERRRANLAGTTVGRFDYVPDLVAYDKTKHAASRAALREQLDAAPVAAADVDYLAGRAGQRRCKGQTLGPTQHMLDEERAKAKPRAP